MKVSFKLIGFAVGFALLCAAGVSAQIPTKPIDAAVMLDEYGRIGACDHSAPLDNFTIALQNDSNLEGYCVYYGPESSRELTLGIIKDYLVNTRGLAEERFKTIYAGPNSDPSEPRVQLWLAPRGTQPPELARYESKTETFNGLFDEHYVWDSVYPDGLGEATGPPVPGVSFPTFVDMLNNRKDTTAYIVAFSGTVAAPGAWRRVAQQEAERLQSNGVAANRIRTIYGGSDKASRNDGENTKIQLWILPADARPPVADAGAEPPPSKTIEIGSYGDYGFGGLGDEEVERRVFEVLLGALRSNKDLRVCIVVRLQQNDKAEEPDEAKEEAPPLTEVTATADEIPDAQPADLLKLVEKWKTELVVEYKIREDRLVVLFAAAREDEGNSLQTWVVPLGALLPDPNAEPEETSEEAKPAETVEADTEKGRLQSEAGKLEVRIDNTEPEKARPDKKDPPR